MSKEKLIKLKNILKKYPGAVVAFSGGVDSSLLLKVCKDVLKDRVIAVSAVSSLYPEEETSIAKKIAQRLKAKHILIKSAELKNPKFIQNPKNRCYYCKIELFSKLKAIAQKYGFRVVEASNESDLKDFRPGLIAAKKLSIESPLIKAGLNKKGIRTLAKEFGLPNWDKPSQACLASRIPYGTRINKKIIKRIASGERYLKKLKLTQVRIRDHYPVARIEVLEGEIERALKHRQPIVKFFKRLGYKYITLDLEGYKTGSMNR